MVSIDAEIAFDQNQQSFMIKTNKAAIEGMYVDIMKATYDKPRSNLTFNSEKLKAFL